jgi:hypothetical protein
MVSLELPPQIISLQLPLIFLNNVFALALGPKHQFLRVSISLPILAILLAQSLYRQWDAGWGNHFGLNCAVWATAFTYVDWILLSNPDKEGWYKIQYGQTKEIEQGKKQNGDAKEHGKATGDGVAKEGYQDVKGGAGRTFWSRLWWGMRLATTTRYVGWYCQVKNVPVEVPSDYPRL